MTDAFSEALGLTPVVDPRGRPAPRQRPGAGGQSRRRRKRRSTKRPVDAFEEAMRPEPQAAPQQEAPVETVQPVEHSPGIDFSGPVEEVRQAIKALPANERKSALKQWAKQYVAKEREGGGVLQTATDRVRDLARGTPVGSWLDEANALTSSTMHRIGLGGAPYNETKAYQNARDEAADNESTKQFSLPVIGDVHTSGLTKLAGGILSAPVAPMAHLFRGGTVLPQIGNAAVTGAGYGAVYGAGEGDTAVERGQNALIGGGAGGVLGAGVPLVAQGAKSIIGAAKPPIAPKAIRKFHPAARKKVERAVGDDLLSPGGNARSYTVQSAKLGDEGMLADMGTNLIGQADAIANQPGQGKAIIRGALRARDRGGQERINASANKNIGPDVDGETTVSNFVKQSQDSARPLYKQFRETPIDITPRIKRIMGRVRAVVPNIDEVIAKRMIADDVPSDVIDNNGLILDYMKKAVDAVAGKAAREGDGGMAGTASRIARDLRDAVDHSMFPDNPGQSIYAQARKEARRGITFKEGYQDGKKVLDDTVSLGRLRMDNAARTPDGLEGVRTGAREKLRQKMYTARSAFDQTSRDKAAATQGRRLLSSEETRGKLREIVGPDSARNLERTLDAEGQMAGVSNSIQGNSATASRLAGQKEFPNAVAIDAGKAANELGKKNLTGLIMETGYRVANFVLDGALDERRIQIAQDAAEMLVAQGHKRDEIAKALIKGAQGKVKTESQRKVIMNLARGIVRGGSPGTTMKTLEATEN